MLFFFSSRRRHTRCSRDWSSDVCSSDLESRAAGKLAVHPRLRLATPDRTADTFEITAQLEHVTRLDDPLEPAVVDPCEERELASILLFAENGDRARLRECFHDQHAGHHRPVRKVAAEIPLVGAHRLSRDRSFAGPKLEHFVDEEEGLAVRQDLLDRCAAERWRDRHAAPESLSRNRLRPRWA